MAEYVTRRNFITLLAAAAPGALAFAPSFSGSSLLAQASPAPDPKILSDLVAGNHILVRKGVIVIHGHLSVRHDKNPNRFFMSRAIAPELIVPADIMEFDLDSKAIDPKGRDGYQERFIHSEIYRARPEINAVIHAHTPSLLPLWRERRRLEERSATRKSARAPLSPPLPSGPGRQPSAHP